MKARAIAVLVVAAAGCFPAAEGLPPRPSDLDRQLARPSGLPPRAPATDDDAGAADAGASFVVPPEPPENEARTLLTHVTRAASQGDRRMLHALLVPTCAAGPCKRLTELTHEVLVADEPPVAGPGTRAYAVVTRVCEDDRACGTLSLLFARDCGLQGTPFRVAEVREGKRGLDGWLAEGKAPCPAGPRRPVAPSPFDPSGTPYPVERR